ncbi:hypothetical protein [Streptomyces sp. NPDC008122]|uniref:hypothetical protein n=1 Tax=Streptomyces sp. NPDC008122 TaxID=3364810 RepID=UPI0036E98937
MDNFFERVGKFRPPGRRDLHRHILPTLAEACALIEPYQHLVPSDLQSVGTVGMHCTPIGLGRDDVDTDVLVKDVEFLVSATSPFGLTIVSTSSSIGVSRSRGRPGAGSGARASA